VIQAVRHWTSNWTPNLVSFLFPPSIVEKLNDICFILVELLEISRHPGCLGFSRNVSENFYSPFIFNVYPYLHTKFARADILLELSVIFHLLKAKSETSFYSVGVKIRKFHSNKYTSSTQTLKIRGLNVSLEHSLNVVNVPKCPPAQRFIQL